MPELSKIKISYNAKIEFFVDYLLSLHTNFV